MSRTAGVLVLLASAACAACATTAPPPATALPPPARPADDDVTMLKERVSRLERRLADVDAKLGLLLAQRSARRQDHRPDAISRGAPDLGPRDLIADAAPKEEASLGARSIDLSTRPSEYADPPEPPEPRAVAPEADEDSGPPIVIKVVGDAPRDRAVDDDHARKAGAPRSTLGMEEPIGLPVADQYAWAMARLKDGKYDEAEREFEQLAARHPHHNLADNAVYWTGFCEQARGNHRAAVDVWQKLPMRFPRSPKIPDALFGMAVSEEALGEPAVAETLYQQLVSQYPRAEKVREARSALSRLHPR